MLRPNQILPTPVRRPTKRRSPSASEDPPSPLLSPTNPDLQNEELYMLFAQPIPKEPVNKEITIGARRWPPSHGNPDYYNDAYCFLCDSSFVPRRIAIGDPEKASNLLKSFKQNCIKKFRLATKEHTLTSSQLLYFKKGRGLLSWNYVPFFDELEDILELCHRKKGGHSSIEETVAEFESLGIWWDKAKQAVFAYVQECSCVVHKRGGGMSRRKGRKILEAGGRLDILEDSSQPSNPFD